jgi:FkbM family methyltransferase
MGSIPIRGIVHLGANYCQEHEEYIKVVPENKIFWVEALPDIVEEIKRTRPTIQIVQALLTDVDNQDINFNISSNNGLSSSIFEFHLHKIPHPSVFMKETIILKTFRLDTLVQSNVISIGNANVLILDLQGAELRCLRGMGALLRQFDMICSEVNVGETYLHCDQLKDLDDYLLGLGFEQKHISIWPTTTYGDAIYMRRRLHPIPDNA